MSIQRHSHSWLWWDWERIDYNSLKNLPETNTIKYYHDFDNTTWTWAYSGWSFIITTWFRPKRIDILATRDSSNEWASMWTCIIDDEWNIKQSCMYLDWSFTNVWSSSWTEIWIIKQTAQLTALFVTAVSDTWFTLGVNNNNWTFNAAITVQW